MNQKHHQSIYHDVDVNGNLIVENVIQISSELTINAYGSLKF